MQMRKLWLLVIPLPGVAAVFCSPVSHRATVEIVDGVTVSLIGRAMFGIHSDWHRRLRVETPAGVAEADLPDDSGWWRGSNLYVHTAGVYVLDEGQVGCLGITISPLALGPAPTGACDKRDAAGGAAFTERRALSARPPSTFYPNLHYIGRFQETQDRQQPLDFVSADQQPETELPDGM